MSLSVHATALLVGAHGVLVRGASGSGKSALALALIERGARLIADDRVTLAKVHERVIATAPRATAGMIELRGHGILHEASERGGVIRLVADIVEEDMVERMPEPEELVTTLLGITVRRQPVPPHAMRAAQLVQAALGVLPHRDAGLRSAKVWG